MEHPYSSIKLCTIDACVAVIVKPRRKSRGVQNSSIVFEHPIAGISGPQHLKSGPSSGGADGLLSATSGPPPNPIQPQRRSALDWSPCDLYKPPHDWSYPRRCLDSAACPICHRPTSLGDRRRSPLSNHKCGSPTWSECNSSRNPRLGNVLALSGWPATRNERPGKELARAVSSNRAQLKRRFVVMGNKVYKTRAEAEKEVTVVCKW